MTSTPRAALLALTAVSMSLTVALPVQAAPTCFGREATIVADDGYTEGTRGSDVIIGVDRGPGTGNDRINGRGGNDFICSGSGNDTVRGAGGNDRIKAGAGGTDEYIYGGRGRDVLRGQDGDDRLFGGRGGDRIYGNSGEDVIEPQGGHDLVRAGDGIDSVLASPGDDVVDGGEGDGDRLFFDQGQPTLPNGGYDSGPVVVDLAAETASSQDGRDKVTRFEQIIGSRGDDTLLGSDADERFSGNLGDDHVDGRGGDDILYGDDIFSTGRAAGDDKLAGGDGSDQIVFTHAITVDLEVGTAEGEGQDELTGIENVQTAPNEVDTIRGDANDNVLDGGGRDDIIEGRGGDDTLLGRLGDDQLDGGDGIDTADGGGGTDTCTNVELTSNCEM